MDYKELYHTAVGWYTTIALNPYMVYDVTLQNVVRLLMKVHTITLQHNNSRVTISTTKSVSTIYYGNKTTTTRLIDTIYIVDKLLLHYTLVQQEYNLHTIVPDIQRKIVMESNAINSALNTSKALNSSSIPLLPPLCAKPIYAQEMLRDTIRYVLDEEPYKFVVGTLALDNKTIELDAVLYTLSMSATQRNKANKLPSVNRTYGVSNVPIYTKEHILINYNLATSALSSTTREYVPTTNTNKYTIIDDIEELGDYLSRRIFLYVDIYTIKHVYSRRLSCVKHNPNYATDSINTILSAEKAKLSTDIATYVYYAFYLFPSYYIVTGLYAADISGAGGVTLRKLKSKVAEYESIVLLHLQ